jgi:haloalkane dehalogenase
MMIFTHKLVDCRGLPAFGGVAVDAVRSAGEWLATTNIPKLFVNADPGSILTGRARDFCRTWPNQEEVTVKGLHFVQEDSPDEIGQAIAGFVNKLN